MKFSIVIPAYDEAESLPELLYEIQEVMAEISDRYEVIVVNDGSTDHTSELLEEAHERDPRIREVCFTRNFGKSAAYLAGFREALGDFLITLDADLQDDPHEIPHMLEVLEKEEYDLIVGWKQSRMGNEPGKALPSKVFNTIIHALFGLKLQDSNCGFRIMRREVVNVLDLYGDIYRFIPEIAHVHGYRVGEVPVHHRRRKHGTSKYGAVRFMTGLMDLFAVRFVTAFKQKPLQFFGALSVPLFGFGGGLELYVLSKKLFFASPFQTHIAAIVIGVLFILIGLQTFTTGLIAEILASSGRHSGYVIRGLGRKI